ncbi:MAG: response regulator transcription factor [Chitinophagaceae bacterium]|nr:response regulator transcription factor [Chitinophagaceae bacterium]
MNKWKCVIADDEPIARDIIQSYCSHLSYLEVVAACANALEAKAALAKEQVDILFLDINMPVMTGISFLKTLKNPPQVIFTTAYKEFAVDAFDLAACDYLLKPFSLERFIVAVDKAVDRLHGRSPVAQESVASTSDDSIFIKTEGRIYKVMQNDILYAEASGNYTKMVTAGNTFMPAMTFSNAEELLPKNIFIRVHRSFIINRSKIGHIEGNRVYIGKVEIPIGSNYKESFLKEIGLSL